MIRIEHNAITGEIIEIEMTSEEIANKEAFYQDLNAKEQEKQLAKQELLNRLGITEEEAKLLLS